MINGRPVKAVNNYYNKKKAELQSLLKGNKKTSRSIQRLSTKRGFKIDDYLHKSSRFIINQLVKSNISTIVIGKNDNWKQELNIGRVNNQNFTENRREAHSFFWVGGTTLGRERFIVHSS